MSGAIPVTVDITGNAVKTEFYVDGCLYDSVTSSLTGQHTFNWDATANHLPIPNHPIDYGYYGVVGVHTDEQLHFDYSSEVNIYTNAFGASRAAYKLEGDEIWMPLMSSDIANAVAQNRRISLDLTLDDDHYINDPTHMFDVLDVAEPYWDHILRVEVLHEPKTWGAKDGTVTKCQMCKQLFTVKIGTVNNC